MKMWTISVDCPMVVESDVCEFCLVGTPHHPSAPDLHVILVHDGVRFVECTEADR